MSADARDREFAAFVGGRGTPLLRIAYLVSGDAVLAEDELLDALARTRNEWTRAEGTESAEAYVRRQLLAARPRLSLADVLDPAKGVREQEGRGGADRRVPAGEGEGDGAGEAADEDEQDRALLWTAFRELPRSERAVLVLGLHESLDDEEIAYDVGRSTRAVQSDIARALGWLRTFADPPGRRPARPMSDRLRDLFAARATDVRAEGDLAERALARAEEQRQRRRWKVLLGTGAVLVVVAALGLGAVLGDDEQGAGSPVGSASPQASATGSSTPGGSPGPSVAAVPDAVLALARDEGALVGYGSVIVDGASTPLAVVVDTDPATGASRGGPIQALARAEGGYVVLTGPPGGAASSQDWTLSYVPRVGNRVELGNVRPGIPGFAVSPDGLSVVHVVAGPVPGGENALLPGQTELVLQTIGSEVLNRITVDGPAEPLAVDSDKVWFERLGDAAGPPYVWDRRSGQVERMRVGRGLTAAEVHGDLVLVRETGARGCFAFYDGHDVRAPHRLWRSCPGSQASAIEPSGATVAMLAGAGEPGLLVVDAGTGDPLGRAAVEPSRVVQLSWAANGQRLLVETRAGDTYAVMGVPPPTLANPVIGATVTYPLDRASVVLGRELPLPGPG